MKKRKRGDSSARTGRKDTKSSRQESTSHSGPGIVWRHGSKEPLSPSPRASPLPRESSSRGKEKNESGSVSLLKDWRERFRDSQGLTISNLPFNSKAASTRQQASVKSEEDMDDDTAGGAVDPDAIKQSLLSKEHIEEILETLAKQGMDKDVMRSVLNQEHGLGLEELVGVEVVDDDDDEAEDDDDEADQHAIDRAGHGTNVASELKNIGDDDGDDPLIVGERIVPKDSENKSQSSRHTEVNGTLHNPITTSPPPTKAEGKGKAKATSASTTLPGDLSNGTLHCLPHRDLKRPAPSPPSTVEKGLHPSKRPKNYSLPADSYTFASGKYAPPGEVPFVADEQAATSEGSRRDSEGEKPKRKRGRPPKRKVDEVEDDGDGSRDFNGGSVKRGRGGGSARGSGAGRGTGRGRGRPRNSTTG